ncbi:hypothetical protein L6164_019518 [Bauhinia variegata]|uniref:Uncharacterized protein n=1 Tax=Bauhinia variegata TaxID=167791 RepID=A0ACB9MS04_BAUVA|nr:hypothetical protein L6164_019518 [Bauhinia variegata]
MLVQKRNSDINQNNASVSTIKLKVKYGTCYHEIRISSHASFGELKKMLAEPTGLHPQDQKLFFKKKERDSKSYLDLARVKDGSKMVLIEDIDSRERRRLETIKLANRERNSKCLAEIKVEVDKLAKQVAALEESASTGGIVSEMDVGNWTDNLMRILIKLDDIVAEGDLKLQQREQVRSVRKLIESLDTRKMPKSIPQKNEDKQKIHLGVKKSTAILQKNMESSAEQVAKQPLTQSESVVVTTKWEVFD